MKINSENFVEEMKRRNPKALDYVVNNYLALIKAIVRKHLINLSSIQDECINDILLSIWSNIFSYDQERSEFEKWVAGISKFKSIDYKRKYLKNVCYENIDDLDIPMEDKCAVSLLNDELKSDIDSLLDILKDEDKELFRKIFLEEKSISEVSEEIGISKAIMYNRISRGKKRLKEKLSYIIVRGE